MIVLCNGVFDPLHYGHLIHLTGARRMGASRLVVAVTTDRSVNKGPNRPVFSEHQRAAIVAELRCVDDVILVDSSLEALSIVKPQVFVKGSEYKNNISKEDEDYCREHGIRIAFTDGPVFSSTALLKHYDRLRENQESEGAAGRGRNS